LTLLHARIAERERIVEVVRPIQTRVGAPVQFRLQLEAAALRSQG
jgi:hypothetical protein